MTLGTPGSPRSRGSPVSRRWSLGRIAVRRSLGPRSATTRCLTLPLSRCASTMRMYWFMVPFLERTLTVLGYMMSRLVAGMSGNVGKIDNRDNYHDDLRGIQGEKPANVLYTSESNCHYAFGR